jgi:hypothetical protein
MLDTIELYWPKGKPSPELEELVVADIRKYLGESLDSADELMFHIVTLQPIGSENFENAPSVLVKGVDGDHRFWCEYHNKFAGPSYDLADFPGLEEKLEAARKKLEDDK